MNTRTYGLVISINWRLSLHMTPTIRPTKMKMSLHAANIVMMHYSATQRQQTNEQLMPPDQTTSSPVVLQTMASRRCRSGGVEAQSPKSLGFGDDLSGHLMPQLSSLRLTWDAVFR